MSLGIYLLYVLAVILILDTPFFRWAAKLEDPTLTYAEFSGAWSLVPGKIHIREFKVVVLDSNVDIEVKVRDIVGWINPLRLLRSEVDVLSIRGERATFRYLAKTASEGAAFHGEHSSAETQKSVSDEELELRARKNWKIFVRGIVLNVESASFEGRELRGQKMKVRGGFFLQPGTAAEVFPSSLEIEGGAFGSGITRIQLRGETRFHRFWLRDSSGDQIFRYFDVDVTAKGAAENFEALNLTLRSLPGYRFRRLGGNVQLTVAARKGMLQPGSELVVDPSQIEFESPQFELAGRGKVRWFVPWAPGASYSEIESDVRAVRFKVQAGKMAQVRASASRIQARARIQGLHLVKPFVGVRARVDLREARVFARGIRKFKADPHWSVKGLAKGGFSLVSGDEPPASWPFQRSKAGLTFEILFADFISSVTPTYFDATGKVRTDLEPVDLRTGRARFSDVDVDLSVGTRMFDRFSVSLKTKALSRILPVATGGDGNWSGSSVLKIGEFGTMLTALKDTLELPGLAVSLLGARNLMAEFDWELTSEQLWLRAPRIETDGGWTAWGTLVHSFLTDQPELAVEARVLSVLPIGLVRQGSRTSFTLFPTAGWFDARVLGLGESDFHSPEGFQ